MLSEAIDNATKLFRAVSSAMALIIVLVAGIVIGGLTRGCERPRYVPATGFDWQQYEKDMRAVGIVLDENGLYKEENRRLSVKLKELAGLVKRGAASGQTIMVANPMPAENVVKFEVRGNDTVYYHFIAPDLDLPISGMLSENELMFRTWNPLHELKSPVPVRRIYRFSREADNFFFALKQHPDPIFYDGVVVSWYTPFFEWRGLHIGSEYGYPQGFALYAEARARVWKFEVLGGANSRPNIYTKLSLRF